MDIRHLWGTYRLVADVPKRSKRRKNKPRKHFRWGMLLFWCALPVVLVITGVVLAYGFWASTFDMEAVKQLKERSVVYDMDGRFYSRLHGENRVVVPLSQVSKNFVDALLAREDTRFYRHRGLDPIGIARAIIRNLSSGEAEQGASTLTQQLARNSFAEEIGSRKTIHRKLLEAFVAARIEQHFTKEEILEHYMNRIYFGSGVYGVETASLAYFGKSAKDLTLGEGAMLAGIIRAPSALSPFRNLKGASRARDAVLARMVKLEKITQAQAEEAKKAPVRLAKRRVLQYHENYAMDAVLEELQQRLTDEQLSAGGLKIYTTIDPDLQKAAQESMDVQLKKVEARKGYAHPKRAEFSGVSLEEEMETPYLQGALVVIDHRTGGIRAVVGGRDYGESRYNRAFAEPGRQVGSTFKPFVYAAAYGAGVLPGALIDDGPIKRGEVRSAPTWTPGNSDGESKGMMRADDALAQSRNTVTVRLGERAGIDAVANMGRVCGVENVPRQPAAYLGAFEENVLRMTEAYTVLAANGVRRRSYLIERIDDASGGILYRARQKADRVMDPGLSWLVTSGLVKAMERGGTGAGVKGMGFSKPSAGKTGTTNDYRDAWFVGYTSSLTCGVWVGFDRPKTIVSKGYGATLALPIWADVMVAASQKRYPAVALKPDVKLERVAVCAVSSEYATNACERAGTSYGIDLPPSCLPKGACRVHSGSVITSRRQPAPKKESGGILRSFRRFFSKD